MSGGIPVFLRALNAGEQPSPELITGAMKSIVEGTASDAEIGAFLFALRISNLDRDANCIAIAAEVMKSAAMKVDYVPPMKNINNLDNGRTVNDNEGNINNKHDDSQAYCGGLVDIVGTGGDGHNTFNISTLAGIIAAGAGVRVCKHGNKASTSKSGSADILSAYGCVLPSVSSDNVGDIFEKTNFCFLLAPLFHPSLAKIGPIRKAIGVPSIFNILGPLLNPAIISSRLIGVSDRTLGEVFAQALLLMSCERAMIVWGQEGLDEISPAGPTQIWRIVPGSRAIYQSVVIPASFGLKSHPLDDVKSGTPEENAALLKELLDGKMPDGHPIKDFSLMNAAALLVVSGKCSGWKEGVKLARESLDGGNARKALDGFKDCTLTL